MFDLLDGWKFLAGLGIFLFGMVMMEESIKLLSGRSFKVLIRRYTGTPAKGLLTGNWKDLSKARHGSMPGF